ncbi:prepilin peptidase [Crossiella cryophila]|uniref:Leader peptidase (Prepilin peptidase)/N-methyltransferase n=1 Tax=Crossiella cryophila TaxID=43355 RepID=A0A7W7CDZ5_9PSEU|nr:prepilin peptidase [Crossiella cryophila]MBB4679437.1 leader peptidase (prepilin peptidase)/N-methyltransferase [Crossiella cryophila]
MLSVVAYQLAGAGTGLLWAACQVRMGRARDRRELWLRGIGLSVAGLLLTTWLACRLRDAPATAAWCWLAVFSLVLAAVDLEHRRLPHPLTAALGLGGVVLLALASVMLGAFGGLWRALAAAAVVGLVTVAVHVLWPAGFGGGDAVLLPVLALFLGFLGWEHVVRGLTLSFLLTGLVAVALLAIGRAQWGHGAGFPAGPPLLAGALLVVITH